MKKINYKLNKNNIIIGYHTVPFDETLPCLELDDDIIINVGYDSVINGKYVSGASIVGINNRIMELKSILDKTDYLTLKFMDGALTEEEYAPIRKQRQAYRDEINQLEAQL